MLVVENRGFCSQFFVRSFAPAYLTFYKQRKYSHREQFLTRASITSQNISNDISNGRRKQKRQQRVRSTNQKRPKKRKRAKRERSWSTKHLFQRGSFLKY